MFLLFLIGLETANNANAQVTIGSNAAPDKFSLLDLVTTNIQKGIHMPRLTTVQRNALIAATTADSTNAKGLAVFNTTINCYDVWNGTQWLSLCSAVSNPLRIIQQPAPFTFRRLWDTVGDPNSSKTATAVTLSVAASGSGTLTYAWYERPKNMNSTVRGAALATTATYSPAVTTWGMRSYYCVVKNGTDSVVSNVADVAVGCGAKTVNGGWVKFMCQNLGAAPAPANLDAITFANDTTSSDAKGWLFQWGRVADGHQWRSSQTHAGPYNNPLSAQVTTAVADTAYYGRFITNTDMATFTDWRTPQATVSWNAWNTPITCPSGWNLPTAGIWSDIFAGNQNWGPNSIALANTWSWVGYGYAVRPDNITTTLWLPAAGARWNSGLIQLVTQNGYYATSSAQGIARLNLSFFYGFISPALPTYGAYGVSVICVSTQ